MKIDDRDAICAKIISSIHCLEELLDDEKGRRLFDVNDSALCAERRLELHRLGRSLDQYVARSKALKYIGFVGHFSSGKSSTINTILDLWGQKGERLTGLHPTDKAVTLITDPINANSLIGLHSRGEVEVGSVLIDSDLLMDVVIVDTPGSGDPSILNEMVRDFLPICDLIIYVFSAANPLDDADLPLLRKSHEQLPFIPIKIIITRADEFKRENKKELSRDNFNSERSCQFMAELISRVAAALPGKAIPEENILIIDNLSQFNVSQIKEFILCQTTEIGSGHSLHTHKVLYYINNAKSIRNFFRDYLERKLMDLNSLVTTAKNNHKEYQRAVLISNNRLTEDWQKHLSALIDSKTQLDTWISSLASRADLPTTITKLPAVNSLLDTVKKDIEFLAASEAESLARSMKGYFSNVIYDNVKDQIDELKKVRPEDLEKFSIKLFGSFEDKYKFTSIKMPLSCSDKIERLESIAISEIKGLAENLMKNLDNISHVIDARLLLSSADEVINVAERQINEMLDTFFKSVSVYKAAILAINARELAERLSISKAIDDLERMDIANERKGEVKTATIRNIFLDKEAKYKSFNSSCGSLLEKTIYLSTSCKRLSNISKDQSSSDNIKKKIDNCLLDRANDGIVQITSQINLDFNGRCSVLFQVVQDKVRATVLQKFQDFRFKANQIRRRRLKRLVGGATVGAVLGLVGFLIYYEAGYIVPSTLTANIGVAAIADIFLALLSWGIVAVFEKSNQVLAKTKAEHYDETKSEVLALISSSRLEDYSFIDSYVPRFKELIKAKWNSLETSILNDNIIEIHSENYDKILCAYDQLESIKTEYSMCVKKLIESLSFYFMDSDRNLKILQNSANDIKEEAILPSFSMFEQAEADLKGRLDQLRGIEFA